MPLPGAAMIESYPEPIATNARVSHDEILIAIQVAADHGRERRARFEQADAFTFTLPLCRGPR